MNRPGRRAVCAPAGTIEVSALRENVGAGLLEVVGHVVVAMRTFVPSIGPVVLRAHFGVRVRVRSLLAGPVGSHGRGRHIQINDC